MFLEIVIEKQVKNRNLQIEIWGMFWKSYGYTVWIF